MREKKEAVEVVCPNCKWTEIIYIPKEDIPKCPDCKTQPPRLRQIAFMARCKTDMLSGLIRKSPLAPLCQRGG